MRKYSTGRAGRSWWTRSAKTRIAAVMPFIGTSAIGVIFASAEARKVSAVGTNDCSRMRVTIAGSGGT